MNRTKTFLFFLTLLSAVAPLPLAAQIDEETIQHIDSYVNVNPDSAVILCNNALAQMPAKASSHKSYLLAIRGNAHFTLGDNAAAIADFKASFRAAEEVADTTACVNALSDLGVTYRVNQQTDSALICYKQALAMLQSSDSPDLEASILTSIAVLFANQARLDEAVSLRKKGSKKHA